MKRRSKNSLPREAHHWWLSEPSAGAWLFTHQTAGWIYKPDLRSQLPPHLRVFAQFCRAQYVLKRTGRIVGGRWFFQRMSRLSRWCTAPRETVLRTEGFSVYLKTADPRLLQVPNELAAGNLNRRALEHLLSPGDTFMDVGANHGSFSLIAARVVRRTGRLIAVEPQPDLASLVRRSLAANAECDFEVHQTACGDSPGVAEFYIPRVTSGSAGLFPAFSARGDHQVLSVSVRTLDEFVEADTLPGKLVIKLDVEGNELAVLSGAKHLIRARRPQLLLELNLASLTAAGKRPLDLVNLLRELEFARFAEIDRVTTFHELERLSFHPSRNVIVAPSYAA